MRQCYKGHYPPHYARRRDKGERNGKTGRQPEREGLRGRKKRQREKRKN